MAEQLRILLANDDGINAPGIAALERIARGMTGDVWVVAPEQEQSGMAHSLTLHNPVRMRKIAEQRFAVTGTPTDCMLLGLREIVKDRRVDLVLSGVNGGSNVGDDITYSGTVAVAMEATLLGTPAIALSQFFYDRDERIHFETAERFGPEIIAKLLRAGWPRNTFINVNFPACAPEAVKGIKLCPQGKRKVGISLASRTDPKGRPYFWLGGERENTPDTPGVDVDLLTEGYVTITPIQMVDMTDYAALEALREMFG